MDGTGKSSLASALLKELKQRGIKCEYAWCRWSPGVSDVFHFVVRKTLGYRAKQYKFCKPLQLIFPYLKVLDFIIPILFRVRIPSLLGRYVIIDRYVYDALADLRLLGFDISTQKRYVQLFLAMNPKPAVTFLVDVPLQVALMRKNDLSLREAAKYEEIFGYMETAFGFQKVVNLDFNEARNKVLNAVLPLPNLSLGQSAVGV
jgi:thymidylate kinase